jgi:hypothetical protein
MMPNISLLFQKRSSWSSFPPWEHIFQGFHELREKDWLLVEVALLLIGLT